MRLCYFKTDFPSEVTVINVVKKLQPQQMFACFFLPILLLGLKILMQKLLSQFNTTKPSSKSSNGYILEQITES